MVGNTDIGYCRADFVGLSGGLSYLDTASSAQKSRVVIEKMCSAMEDHYANIHRGLYRNAQITTQEYESVRGKVAEFINAVKPAEIIFTRNTTEAINLVATSWGGQNLRKGDEVILSVMEHHANIVPWQLRDGITIKVVPLTAQGTLDIEVFKSLLSDKTKMIGLNHISNALGVINPVSEFIKAARSFNKDIKILIDASQSIVHTSLDVQAMDCDFLTFTGHKLYGPTGVGVLWGREEILNAMPPYQGGGDMIETVTFQGSTFKPAPARFEAGTPAIAEVIGLGAAIDYLRTIGQDSIRAHEDKIFNYMKAQLQKIDGLTFFGVPQVGIISFLPTWAHAADVAMILDKCNVAVRTGHHCCMPLMAALGVEGTIRASIGLYTNEADIDSLVHGLKKAKDMLA